MCIRDSLDHYRTAGNRSGKTREKWEELSPSLGERSEIWATLSGSGLKPDWEEALPCWERGATVATRKASNECIQSLMEFMPGLIGGGADLTGNTGTSISDYGIQSHEEPEGRQIFFGVREHAMGAISNGIALHGALFPVTGTFLVFSDYMRGSVRLAALSNAKVASFGVTTLLLLEKTVQHTNLLNMPLPYVRYRILMYLDQLMQTKLHPHGRLPSCMMAQVQCS